MTSLPGNASFTRALFGNGGQNIRGFVFNDGSAVVAIDAHGAWHRAAGASLWTYLFGATNLPSGVKTAGNTWSGFAGGPVYNSCSGCADIAGCATDSTKFAMIVDGQLCTTTNSGVLFVASGFPRTLMDSNAPNKSWMGHNITYQDNDATKILFGTNGNGVFYSTDGGTTPHSLSVAPGGIVAGYPSPHLTAYDPTSSGNRWFYTRFGITTAITASIAGTTLTVTVAAAATLQVGDTIAGAGVTGATVITALGTGTGGVGTYTVNNSQTVSSEAMTAATTNPGIYESTTGIGGTYSLMASLPAGLKAVNSLNIDASGKLRATGYLEQGVVHTWTSGGGWGTEVPSASAYFAGAVADPADTNRVVYVDDSRSNYWLTRNGGSTFVSWNNNLANAPLQQTEYSQAIRYLDIPTVIAPTQQFNLAANQLQFDPNVPGRLWNFNAIDTCYVDLPSSGGGGTNPLLWVGIGQGIESTVGQSVLSVPGGKSFYSMSDVSCFREDSLTRYVNPQVMGRNPSDTFAAGLIPPALIQPNMKACYAADNPLWMAFMQWGGFYPGSKAVTHFSYSIDGGQTPLPITATVPDTPSFAFGGGSMAVGKQGHAIVIPSYNRLGWYTMDAFATIHYLTTPFDALDGSGQSGWDISGNGFWYNRHVITYDAAGDYYYAMNFGNGNTPNPLGVWRTRLPSGPWVQMYNNTPAVNAIYNTHMKAVLGQAGHLFWLNGPAAGNGYTGTLMRSTDGAISWTTPTTNSGQVIQNVTDIGFGKPAPGATYAAMGFWGQVNGVYGFYRSDDNLASTVFLGSNPGNITDYPNYIEGDPDVYGRFRMTLSGSGGMLSDYQMALQYAA